MKEKKCFLRISKPFFNNTSICNEPLQFFPMLFKKFRNFNSYKNNSLSEKMEEKLQVKRCERSKNFGSITSVHHFTYFLSIRLQYSGKI